jgi:hypothetical protein
MRFLRILMAMAVALVFVGETASAGGPCRQMAQAEVAVPHVAVPACHETGDTPAAAPVKTEHPKKSPCECVALLKASFAAPVVLASSHVEPWRWDAPEAVAFASLDLAPDGHPPKA